MALTNPVRHLVALISNLRGMDESASMHIPDESLAVSLVIRPLRLIPATHDDASARCFSVVHTAHRRLCMDHGFLHAWAALRGRMGCGGILLANELLILFFVLRDTVKMELSVDGAEPRTNVPPNLGYFFSNRKIFEKAGQTLKAHLNNLGQDCDPAKRHMIYFMCVLFQWIGKAPDKFDQCCPFNTKWLGERFVKLVDFTADGHVSEFDSTFSMAYRFVVEYQLMSSEPGPDVLSKLMDEALEYEYPPKVASDIKFAESQMVIRVVGDYIHHPKMVELKDISSLIDKSEKERKVAELLLNEREIRVANLKEKLDTYKTAFNFIGLYDGFKKLRFQKRVEAAAGLAWMFLVGGVMVAPPVYKMYLVITKQPPIDIDMALGLTVVGFELLLAYFFRVALHGYRAVKAQLIQIDLRMALCQFIQDYADYAKNIREDSPDLLNRFDQLIFSGIVNDEGAIPSTFDGLEHIGLLIEKLKAK